MRSNLAQKLATVALGAATLAIANAGQLPAQAQYGPSTPPQNAPGGYHAVVTSQTMGPAGGVIGPVRIDGLVVTLTIPKGTLTTPVAITLLSPNGLGLGTAARPGYYPVGGVGVLIEVNGMPYPGNYGHSLILTRSGAAVSSRDRVGRWDGSTFKLIHPTVSRHTEVVTFVGSGDFAIFAKSGGGRFAAQQTGPDRGGRSTAVIRGRRVAEDVVLTRLFLTAAGMSPGGIGVLAPEWLAASSR